MDAPDKAKTRFREVSPSAGRVPGPAGHDHASPASAEAFVLILEVVQPLGKEHHDHEEKEEDKRGHAHHHAQHLKLGDGPVAARALVPDVVLYIAPAHERFREMVLVFGCLSAWKKTFVVVVVVVCFLLLVTVLERKIPRACSKCVGPLVPRPGVSNEIKGSGHIKHACVCARVFI